MSKKRTVRYRSDTADVHELYQIAVQCPEAEVDFATRWFRRLRGRPLRRLCEDFCGTALIACDFVRRHRENEAEGIDIDGPTLAWARRHNVARLTPDQQRRVRLVRRNVLHPRGVDRPFDAVIASNFSYWVFKSRARLLTYFRTVREALVGDGIFFLDAFGGWESMKEMTERRRCRGGFTYIWDQARYDPITGDLTCHIHFEFARGRIERAFTYHWRLWTIPEIREALDEAGFRRVTVYWEREDKRGRGTGVFTPRKHGEADASFVVYLTAEA
jgi:SAM-dependent methyltransferase